MLHITASVEQKRTDLLMWKEHLERSLTWQLLIWTVEGDEIMEFDALEESYFNF